MNTQKNLPNLIYKVLELEKMSFFDTETSGLDPNTLKLLEFYRLTFNIKKNLDISIVSELQQEIEIKFNDQKQTFKFEKIEYGKDYKINKIILKNGDIIEIKLSIPLLKTEERGKVVNKLLFGIGIPEVVKEYNNLYDYGKSEQSIPALLVHKIINKSTFPKEKRLELMKEYVLKYEKKENKIHILKNLVTEFKKTKNDNEKEEIFERFLKLFGFRNSEGYPVFKSDDKNMEEIVAEIFKFPVGGHNLQFDIKTVMLSQGVDVEKVMKQSEKMESPVIIDTMYQDRESKKRKSLDALIYQYLKEDYQKLESFFNKYITDSLLRKMSKNEQSIIIKYLKEGFFSTKIKTEKDLSDINNLSPNNEEDVKIINEVDEILKKYEIPYSQEFKSLNSTIQLYKDRQTLHTAKLDITLNVYVFFKQIKDHIERYGFEGLEYQGVSVSEILNKNVSIQEKSNEIIQGLLGVRNDGLNIDDYLLDVKEKGYKTIGLNSSSRTMISNQKSCVENNIKGLNLLQIKLLPEDINIHLLLKDEKRFESTLLIRNKTINKEDLILLLNELNVEAFLPFEYDNVIKHPKVYLKVDIYQNKNYKKETQNEKILWVSSSGETIGRYLWDRITKNESINPYEVKQLYHKYNKTGIPTKEEVLSIFPYEEYQEIYHNLNKVLTTSEAFEPTSKKEILIPNGIEDSPETSEEYKELMLNILRDSWKKKKMMENVYITAFDKYRKKRINYYLSLSPEEKKKLPKNIDKKGGYSIEEASLLIQQLNIDDISKDKDKFLNYIKEYANNSEEFKKYIQYTKKQYEERIKYEIDVISKLPNYKKIFNFILRMKKLLDRLTKRGIKRGPGRGSVGGSLIAFMLEITDVDPMFFGLLFGRFISPDQISDPDIDVDFSMNSVITKDAIINILKEEFDLPPEKIYEVLAIEQEYNPQIVKRAIDQGYTETITKIGTEIELTPKTLVTHLLRLIGVPYHIIISAMKTWDPAKTYEENIYDSSELQNMLSILDFVPGFLEELRSNLPGHIFPTQGTHAGGVLIYGQPANAVTEIDSGKTAISDPNVSKIKFDLLGVQTLFVTQDLQMLINEGVKSLKIKDVAKVSSVYSDSNVYKTIQEGKTAGLFQIESDGMTKMLKELAPIDFQTLMVGLALYRPGPIQAGMVDAYIYNKFSQYQTLYKGYFTQKQQQNLSKLTKEETNEIFDKFIKSQQNAKLLSPDLFHRMMVSPSYLESSTFKHNIKNKLIEITQRVKDGDDFEGEELTTLEKIFLKKLNYDSSTTVPSEGKINQATDKTIEYRTILEKNILKSKEYQKITQETNGVLAYQEQIMAIVTEMGGMTTLDASMLRKAISKKNYELFNKIKEELIPRLLTRIEKVETEKISIEQNQNFELILNLKGENKEINLYGSKFDVEGDEIKLNLTNSKLNLYEILKKLGGSKSIEKVDELENIMSKNRDLMKNMKNKSKELNKDELDKFHKLKKENLKLEKEVDEILSSIKEETESKLLSYLSKEKINEKQIIRKTNYDEDTANYLFDNIVSFGGYAFNKSHSAAYAIITYLTAHFKNYYPLHFYASSLSNSSLSSAQKMLREISLSEDMSIDVPTINEITKTGYGVNEKKNSVVFAIDDIKSVSKLAITAIADSLKNSGEFKNPLDILLRIPSSLMTKTTIKQLGKVGILNDIISPLTPKIFEEYFEEINEVLKEQVENNQNNFINSFVPNEKIKIKEFFKIRNKIEKNRILSQEIETTSKEIQKIQDMVDNGSIDHEQILVEEEKISKIIEGLESKKIYVSNDEMKLYNKYINHENFKKIYLKSFPIEIYLNDISKKLDLQEKGKGSLFFDKIKDGENYTTNEQNAIFQTVFGEYNPYIPEVDFQQIKEGDVSHKLEQFKEIVEDYKKSLEKVQDKFPDLNNIEQNYDIHIGSTPKILYIQDVNRQSNVPKEIILNNENLIKKELSFTKDGREIIYYRYYDSNGNEYKYQGVETTNEKTGETKYIKKLQIKNGKSWSAVKSENYQVKNATKVEEYIKEISEKTGNKYTLEDFVILPYYYPLSSVKGVRKSLLNDEIFINSFVKFYKKTSELKLFGLTIAGVGSDAIKKIKLRLMKGIDTRYNVPVSALGNPFVFISMMDLLNNNPECSDEIAKLLINSSKTNEISRTKDFSIASSLT